MKRLLSIGLIVVSLAVVLGAAAWWLWPPELHGVLLQSPDRASDFSLSSSRGGQAKLSDFRGKFVLLYFGYTSCPDICPMTLAQLLQVRMDLAERADEVQVLFVTVDPQRDTAERLALYLGNFDPTFVGLTGAPEEIDAVASQFGVYYEVRSNTGATSYLLDHTSTVAVIDPKGFLRMVFPSTATAEEMSADLRYLMRKS